MSLGLQGASAGYATIVQINMGSGVYGILNTAGAHFKYAIALPQHHFVKAIPLV